jgi:hypothetical protein
MVVENETWTLQGSPHRVPEGLTIRDGASLTLAPCALVLVARDRAFAVGPGGALMAVGDADHPIRIGADGPAPQPGDWIGVRFDARARVTSRLAWVRVERGGGGEDAPACVHSRLALLDVQNVTLRDCRGHGIRLSEDGAFAPSATSVTVSGAVASDFASTGAIYIDAPDAVRTLPSGKYTGNAVDEITVGGVGDVRSTATWRDPGVRYHILRGLRIQGPNAPVLTIAPAARLAFERDAGLVVGADSGGGLVADGASEERRIVFTAGATRPTPGSWDAIVLGPHFDRAASRLAYVTIEYGGGTAHGALCPWAAEHADTALLVFAAAPTSAQIVSHARFVGAPAAGAVVAPLWTGAPLDFTDPALGNDFGFAGARCHVAPVRAETGACRIPSACL